MLAMVVSAAFTGVHWPLSLRVLSSSLKGHYLAMATLGMGIIINPSSF